MIENNVGAKPRYYCEIGSCCFNSTVAELTRQHEFNAHGLMSPPPTMSQRAAQAQLLLLERALWIAVTIITTQAHYYREHSCESLFGLILADAEQQIQAPDNENPVNPEVEP